MPGLNKAIVIGRLGRDPEVRQTQGGTRIGNLSIATSEVWTDKRSGERRENTEWHRIVLLDERSVDVAEKFLRKGDEVCVEGMLQTRKWQDQSGTDRYSTEIVVKPFRGGLTLLDSRQNRDGQQAGHGYGQGAPAGQQGGQDPQAPIAGQQGAQDTRAPYGGGSAAPPAGAPGPGVNDLDDEIPFVPIRDLP